MSFTKSFDKSKNHIPNVEQAAERSYGLNVPETPVKRQTYYQNNSSLDLSPLPLPPKVDHPNMESYGTYGSELRYVETPVVKEPPKFMPIHEEEGPSYLGIVEKIGFESEEDGPNNSSSLDSSASDSEEMSHNSEYTPEEASSESPSQIKENHQEEPNNVGSSETQRENKSRRPSKSRTNTLSKQVNPNKKVFCNCKKTKCLKLYCDCFRLNQTCDGCNCVGCHNLQIYSEQRNNAILALMDRNPDPFGQKIEDDKHVKGCNCKKSNCLKKYCECYQAGLKCGQNCKCEECKNMPVEKGFPDHERGGPLVKNTAKKEKRMLEI